MIEREWSFIMKGQALVDLPTKIWSFILTEKKEVFIQDFVFDKSYEHMDYRTAGVRIRGQLSWEVNEDLLMIEIIDNLTYEITYKQYLWSKNGMNNFLEISDTLPHSKERSMNKILTSPLAPNLKSVLEKMHSLCKLSLWLVIRNFRKVYYYEYKDIKLEVVLENIRYMLGGKDSFEKMLEIELISSAINTKEIDEVIHYFKNVCLLEIPCEWKASRALKYLSWK